MPTLDEKIAGARTEILEFQSSKVWAIWQEYAANMQKSYEHSSIHGNTVEAREQARMAWLSFQEFKNIPFVLVRKVEAISQEEAPKDLP